MLALLMAERILLFHDRTDEKKFTFDMVPAVLKLQTKEILEDSGVGFLVTEE